MITIINDTHLGVNRSGGTTPLSFLLLTEYTHQQFYALLTMADGTDLLINGDLFDGFTVPNSTLSRTYAQMSAWLRKNPANSMYLARGNHDYHPSGDKMSSFDTLCGILAGEYPDQVVVVCEPTEIANEVVVVPHMPNQDLFDAAVKDVIAMAPAIVLFHCNYDNNFAVESDHSLNLSRDQASALLAAGVRRIILGHEHQPRETGGVLVVGNQFPTSVSDCLGNTTKRLVTIDEGHVIETQTWQDAGSYFECPWQEVERVPETAQFVRIKGTAEATEASLVLETISQLRKRHSAFVISNAVVVDGRALDVTAADSFDAVEKFNVMEHLLPLMANDEQRKRVEQLAQDRRHAAT